MQTLTRGEPNEDRVIRPLSPFLLLAVDVMVAVIATWFQHGLVHLVPRPKVGS